MKQQQHDINYEEDSEKNPSTTTNSTNLSTTTINRPVMKYIVSLN